jgi:hypothetical protein
MTYNLIARDTIPLGVVIDWLARIYPKRFTIGQDKFRGLDVASDQNIGRITRQNC